MTKSYPAGWPITLQAGPAYTNSSLITITHSEDELNKIKNLINSEEFCFVTDNELNLISSLSKKAQGILDHNVMKIIE
jgi:hypothetical protein